MGRGSCLVRCPQSDIVDEVGMNPLGRERKEDKCRVATAGCIWFPTRFLNFFLFAKLNQSQGHASIDMKHVRRSGRPLPRKHSSPYSIGRVDGGFRKSIASATDSLGKPSQMTTGSVSSTRPEGCAKEGRIKADYREEEKRRLGRQEAKGQVYAMDEGRGVIPLRVRGSD